MKYLTLLFLLLSLVCKAQDFEDVMMVADSAEMTAINQAIQAQLQDTNFDTNDIITVPVVVHVIHKGEPIGTGTNISDEQVISSIDHMTSRYRNEHELSTDAGIEFCLAQVDPDGNPTNGINRFNGCISDLYCTEGISAGNGQGESEVTVKNWSRWPNQEYYNIWVVSEIENNNGGGGIQGYAYFPTTSLVDGTVLLYNTVGTVGNRKSYTDENEVIIHELGHAFALFHTFQNTFECGAEINCAIQGDRICDTPPTVLNSSCNNPACDGTQQVENYMDYTSETCKDLFTQGQIDRMRLAIFNSRENLIENAQNVCSFCVIDTDNYGDLNGDGVINIQDFALFSAAYGTTTDSDNWNPAIDSNCDGVINIQDFANFSANYGGTMEVKTIDFMGKKINVDEHKGFYIIDYGNGIRKAAHKQ